MKEITHGPIVGSRPSTAGVAGGKIRAGAGRTTAGVSASALSLEEGPDSTGQDAG